MLKTDIVMTAGVHYLFSGLWLLITLSLLSACQTVQSPSGTLGDTDHTPYSRDKQTRVFSRPRSTEEIRKAYSDYLNNATVDEKTRIAALTRLAELEYRSSNELLMEKENRSSPDDMAEEEKLYQQRLNKTIQLLSTSLLDYPDANNNDSLLYQLAKAQAQNGQHNDSITSLNKLAEKYPDSPFYIETQFRIAEESFSRQDYSTAEYSYTEVIIAAGNEVFYEKSLFKRGWARFKQHFYLEAIDDFLQAVLIHKFDEFEKLSTSEREQFDEYFRAVGISFSYLGGPEPLARYFKDRSNFKYTYHTYSMVGDLYLKQERFSDAVITYEQFIKRFPESDNIPYSHLKIIEIWKNSRFTQKLYQAIELFYANYNASSPYWKNQNENSRVNRAVRRSLKEYVILMSTYYHHRYQNSEKLADFKDAEKWYQRYLKHYDSYALQDTIYFNYAELLSQKKKYTEAFKYYELAAYDNDLITNKDAAYASLLVSNKLINTVTDNKSYIKKHIDYALKYSQLFPKDTRTREITLNATELSFKAADYKSAIELADLFLSFKNNQNQNYATKLKADAYFHLNEFKETENLYLKLLKYPGLSKPGLNKKQLADFNDKLALAIYKQGEQAVEKQLIPLAIGHYSRISKLAPDSGIAPTGLYDAIALNIQHEQWKQAIKDIKRFQSLYPQNPLKTDVSKKLSVAYLKSNQGIKAAREFEKLANMDANIDIKSAALWQAAELYEEQGKTGDAIRSYLKYVNTFKKPYSQQIEAMNKLSKLYNNKGDLKSSSLWNNTIIKADEKALNNVKTDRTKFLASSSYLSLARIEKKRFDRLKLTLPLKKSLRNKKAALTKSVKFYAKASVNNFYEISTESTYSIAQIYKDFSKALLNSDRPEKLSDEELDQYEILLEDQAFPFEDKAIEFFEINLTRINDGHYNDWINSSYLQLITLFPVRYDRQPKQDRFVSEMN